MCLLDSGRNCMFVLCRVNVHVIQSELRTENLYFIINLMLINEKVFLEYILGGFNFLN